MTLFWVKVNTPACQKGILTSSWLPFLHFLLFNRVVCHGTLSHAGVVSALSPLGRRRRAHTLRCGLSPCSTGLEQPPLLRSSPGCALACLGVQVISVPFPAEWSCIPSNEQRGTGNHTAPWKQIPALTFKCFKALIFSLPFDLLVCFLIKLFRFKGCLGFCVFHPWYQCICPGRISELVWVLWMPHKTSLNKSRSCGVKL